MGHAGKISHKLYHKSTNDRRATLLARAYFKGDKDLCREDTVTAEPKNCG